MNIHLKKWLARGSICALALTGALAVNTAQSPEAAASNPGRDFTRQKAKEICGSGYVPKRGVRLRDSSGQLKKAYIWVLKNSEVKKYCAVNVAFGRNYGITKERGAAIWISSLNSNGTKRSTVREKSDFGRYSYFAGPLKVDYGSIRAQHPAPAYELNVAGHQDFNGKSSLAAYMVSEERFWPRYLANSWSWVG